MSLVEYEKQGAVASLRLNRPDKLNAIANPMLDEIALTDFVAVSLSKKTINPGAESSGLMSALQQAVEIGVRIESTETEQFSEFSRILKKDRPKAALARRASKLSRVLETR